MTVETLFCDDKSSLDVVFSIVFFLFLSSLVKLIVLLNRDCCALSWWLIFSLDIVLFSAVGNLWQSKYISKSCLNYDI